MRTLYAVLLAAALLPGAARRLAAQPQTQSSGRGGAETRENPIDLRNEDFQGKPIGAWVACKTDKESVNCLLLETADAKTPESLERTIESRLQIKGEQDPSGPAKNWTPAQKKWPEHAKAQMRRLVTQVNVIEATTARLAALGKEESGMMAPGGARGGLARNQALQKAYREFRGKACASLKGIRAHCEKVLGIAPPGAANAPGGVFIDCKLPSPSCAMDRTPL